MAKHIERSNRAVLIGFGLLLAFGVSLSGCSGYTELAQVSDEPPIRVRGGSIEIDLLGSGSEFEENTPNDKKNWKIKGDPARDRPEYTVALVSTAASCASEIFSTAKVEVVYSDGQTVEFVAAQAGTKIKATKDLTHPQGKRLLYGTSGSGYISAIKWQGQGSKTCTFSDGKTTPRVYLLD